MNFVNLNSISIEEDPTREIIITPVKVELPKE